MQRSPGTLFIKCKDARLTHDTETFGKMDPFVKITIHQQEMQTKTHRNAGKNPRWEETLKFKLQGFEEELKLAVYDEDMTKNDLVGDTIFFLDEVKSKGKFTEAVKIAYKGKEAGVVNIEFEFFNEAIQSNHSFLHQAPVHNQGQVNYLPPGMIAQPLYNQMQVGFQQNMLQPMGFQNFAAPGQFPPPQGQFPPPMGMIPPGQIPPQGMIPPLVQPIGQQVPYSGQQNIPGVGQMGPAYQGQQQVPVYNQMQQNFPQYMQNNYNYQPGALPNQYPQQQQQMQQMQQQPPFVQQNLQPPPVVQQQHQQQQPLPLNQQQNLGAIPNQQTQVKFDYAFYEPNN
ncbi:xyppx repeat family protein [Stylonychia lemnae]|uniref:Xyppx repeat family protein n=1 Tax=Stylonychia lemnae TaxID=5949 RepID=A0A078AV64_STYLE|nr:xyppx repeat family protein [Stylonychia lemnae]|eukprot:CDW85876.1 xyppx repeat family protein [Stylonychia lemnae]